MDLLLLFSLQAKLPKIIVKVSVISNTLDNQMTSYKKENKSQRFATFSQQTALLANQE